MKEIPLTQGKTAWIDDEDWPHVSQYKWFARRSTSDPDKYYALTSEPITNDTILMHRLILNAPADRLVDHTDGNGLNNTRSNIRLCNPSENVQNARQRSKASSPYKGVRWNKSSNKWEARIGTASKNQKYLGVFLDPVEAALVYDRAAKERYGKFARLNFP